MTDSPTPFFIDETDHAILMHKAVHFNNSFPYMLEYYELEKKGIQEEFDLDRIRDLFLLEQAEGVDLFDFVLEEHEKQEVHQAKLKYEALKALYNHPPSPAQKLADLILSEEEEPLEEIMELCSLSSKALPLLLSVLKEDSFYNPLFPGYGLAPIHACECLGLLKDIKAIPFLFEAMPQMQFFGEETVVQALFAIGDPAKDFLLSIVKKAPLTKDNENAAIALLPFKDDPLVIQTCLDLLENPLIQQKATLFTYLLFLCEGLLDQTLIQRLSALSKSPLLSPSLQEEVDWILQSCK